MRQAQEDAAAGDLWMKTLLILVAWGFLFVLCWPLALLILVLWPLVWLLSLPFRVVGFILAALFAGVRAVLFRGSPAGRV
jgi:hypothetical protein